MPVRDDRHRLRWKEWSVNLVRWMNNALAVALLVMSSPALAANSADSTGVALQRCLDDPANASTAGQVECEATAARTYDQRMNAAYAALLSALPPKAAQQLRQSQRAWLAFRDAERAAAGQIFATRQGTMYAPMQAGAATNLTRDRALQLESYRRILAIDS